MPEYNNNHHQLSNNGVISSLMTSITLIFSGITHLAWSLLILVDALISSIVFVLASGFTPFTSYILFPFLKLVQSLLLGNWSPLVNWSMSLHLERGGYALTWFMNSFLESGEPFSLEQSMRSLFYFL